MGHQIVFKTKINETEMSLRLSFIVPFYNVEPYIEECIRSLYAQDIPWDEYEVICVDDCSPDRSREIVIRLQDEYPTLHLVTHENNKKQGGARNTGLKNAKGYYVWYIDSDDYIKENCLGTLLQQIDKYNDLDVLHFNYLYVVDGVEKSICPIYKECLVKTGEMFLLDQSTEQWDAKCSTVWRRIHKRDFLIDNQLYFIENQMYEDTDNSLLLFARAKSVLHLDIEAYCYRKNISSITQQIKSPLVIYYIVMLLHRSVSVINQTKNIAYAQLIEHYVKAELSITRQSISKFSIQERIKYLSLIFHQNIRSLRKYCSFRTWMLIQYGINCL